MEKRDIVIRAGDCSLRAEIYDTGTGRAVLDILPLAGRVSRWGDEIYFAIPLSIGREPDARDVVRMGEIGYWPDGNALCIFFGKTPVSRGDEIRAASPVNVFGMITEDPTWLAAVEEGSPVTVQRA
jgi:hypothetical protein